MRLDLPRIKNMRDLGDGGCRGRCPACAQLGGDKKGEHLMIFPDGRFGCAANQGDEEHRRQIWRLAGDFSDLPPEESHFTKTPLHAAEGRIQVLIPSYPNLNEEGMSRIVRMVPVNSL